jgi:hypothetical protein
MPDMNSRTVIQMDRTRRVNRVIAARRTLREAPARSERTRGRIWLNGSELGEAREAFAHLAETYD